ncbi:PEP-CTERM/exosortase system-associated acyltransferase [Salinicola avicenniae]|uniref:PEP-CTERM/exosortase system-associated acyltransferase n=1 Tax=Salinicola avicenniae TaxID=2916836 RepID=UPI002072FCEF|nr:PEP-CTERM/exosortase system-associated acyltransferase [Salinicola sp. S1-1-8]
MGAVAAPGHDFLEAFRLVLATREEDKRRVFALRHRVFCEELDFFANDDAERLERDAFDANALHCLIEHRESGLPIGCLRVVIAAGLDGNALTLPVEKYCRELQLPLDPGLSQLRRETLCEISRVAIPRFFRTGGRETEGATALERQIFSQHERRLFGLTGVALNLCATALSGLTERHHVLAMIEPRFQRLLARVGLCFTQVSPSVELLGTRAAYYIDQRRAEVELSASVRPLYEHLRQALGAQYRREALTGAVSDDD